MTEGRAVLESDQTRKHKMTCIAVRQLVGLMFCGDLSPRRRRACAWTTSGTHAGLELQAFACLRSGTWLPWQTVSKGHNVGAYAMYHGLPLSKPLLPCSLACERAVRGHCEIGSLLRMRLVLTFRLLWISHFYSLGVTSLLCTCCAPKYSQVIECIVEMQQPRIEDSPRRQVSILTLKKAGCW